MNNSCRLPVMNDPWLRSHCINLLIHHGRRLMRVEMDSSGPPLKVYEGPLPAGGYWTITLRQGQIVEFRQDFPRGAFDYMGRSLFHPEPKPDTSAWPSVRVRLIEGDLDGDSSGVVYAVFRDKRTGEVTHRGNYPVTWHSYWIEDCFFVKDIVIDRGLQDAALIRAVEGLFAHLTAKEMNW